MKQNYFNVKTKLGKNLLSLNILMQYNIEIIFFFFLHYRLVMEELAIEQHNISRETDERQIMERKIITEVEHLQNEVEQAKRSAELASQCAETLKLEVVSLESAIVEKKLQVERLVADMKEANLQSLAVACQDEQVKSLFEGIQNLN